MTDSTQMFGNAAIDQSGALPSEPCIMLIFGASGDLTKRLLMPAIYNLACDGLLSENFAILGSALSDLTSEQFRANMNSGEDGIRKFHTRTKFDEQVWEKLAARLYYQKSDFASLDDFKALRHKVAELEAQYQTHNILFYCATAPGFFGQICENLFQAGFKEGPGWRRIILEKPFGTDIASAQALNAAVLKHWDESQIYRIDHYLGKETVQNLLAFRFANGMFEPLWNKNNIDNIQFNVCEEVDVGSRGGYYDKAGVLRDMMQNHMFQMLAYLCMEPPASFEPDAIRNEKSKLLSSVRIYKPEEVPDNFVRGQYGAAFDDEGEMLQPGYRYAQDVDPLSNTETFAAGKLHIDNWRWEGVPIYLRSGKALWKRGTEIVVEFKKAPEAIFRGTSVKSLAPNRLVFHIQPYQGIELLFEAKIPGPTLALQKVDMHFSYSDAFKASRYTGYEVMIYSCTHGDATLFSRDDLVEAAWHIAQPILDYWKATPVDDFPNYVRGSWGPKAANALLAKDGRRWFEVVTPDVLQRSPLFKGSDPVLLKSIIMALRSATAETGEIIIQKGDMADEMYLICSGEVGVLDSAGEEIKILKDGDFFGEIGLLISSPRTATIRANMLTDMFVLDKADFHRILRESPRFAESMLKIAKERYDVTLLIDQLIG